MHETNETQVMKKHALTATGTWMAAISQHFNGYVSRSCSGVLLSTAHMGCVVRIL